MQELSIEEEVPVAPAPTPQPTTKKKKNRAKQRLQRREAEMQRLREEAEKEASEQVDMAALEREAIDELLGPMKLRVREASQSRVWRECSFFADSRFYRSQQMVIGK